jgi:ubiquinone/menaquinone biosynthesis C-methylase UbiE
MARALFLMKNNPVAKYLRKSQMNEPALIDTRSAAEVYDQQFVPALFRQWGNIIKDVANVVEGNTVLDVACGTGVLAQAAQGAVGERGRVVGLDVNTEMLDVARRKSTVIDWREGLAEDLPFADETFDRVVSQFGLMFFEDKPRALHEAFRTLRRGGRMAFAVCDALDHSPGYAVFAELLHRLFGHEVAEAFRAPFSLGDPSVLTSHALKGGVQSPEVTRIDGSVRFDSILDLVHTERACAWTLGGLLDTDQFDRLLVASQESLDAFLTRDGRLEFTMPTLVLTADKPR